MNKEEEKEPLSWDRELMEKYPILYRMRNSPMTETCMCWGLECGKGWEEPLDVMSARLEMLNLTYYPKYGIRIEMNQVKSKFATLRAYFTVMRDCRSFTGFMSRAMHGISRILNHSFDFKMCRVVDSPREERVEIKELPNKVEFLKEKHYAKNCSNVEVYEQDGKHYKKVTYCVGEKAHFEPTKHKLVKKIANLCRDFGYWFACFPKLNHRHENEIQTIMTVVMHEADKIVRETETACANTCEWCGNQIGTNWSPRCEMTGWITYVCNTCAEKSDAEYYKNGEIWRGKMLIKTKEQLKAENDAIESKLKARSDKYKKEEAEFQKELEAAEAELAKMTAKDEENEKSK